jgi:hypothetical protein
LINCQKSRSLMIDDAIIGMASLTVLGESGLSPVAMKKVPKKARLNL